MFIAKGKITIDLLPEIRRGPDGSLVLAIVYGKVGPLAPVPIQARPVGETKKLLRSTGLLEGLGDEHAS